METTFRVSADCPGAAWLTSAVVCAAPLRHSFSLVHRHRSTPRNSPFLTVPTAGGRGTLPKQGRSIVNLVEAAESGRDRLLLTVVYQHGLRVSEALSLTKGHVVRGYLQLKPKKKGRRADERLDPATAELWAKVTEHILPRTLVFPISRQWASVIFHRCERFVGNKSRLLIIRLPTLQPNAPIFPNVFDVRGAVLNGWLTRSRI